MKSAPALRFGSLLFCGLLGAGLANSALAQSPSGAQGLLDDKWVFNLGGFIYGTSLDARLDGQSSTNPGIDVDSTFGKADDATRVRADVLWRITPEHRLRAMYFDNSVTRSKVLANDVEWGDYTFLAGSRADFKHSFEALELAYEYAFVRRPNYEVAASLGVHYMDLKLQLSGTASVTGPGCATPPCTATATSKANGLPMPLPVVGLRAGWVVAPNWYVDAQGQFFKVKVGDYDGSWTDLRVGATWMFHRNYGVGLAYNRFASNLDVTKSDFNGELKLGYSGAQVYLTASF